jgi:hypothetical protein
MVSKFSNIMININKVIGNRSTFFSGGVTLCTRNVKYFCHLSVPVDKIKYVNTNYRKLKCKIWECEPHN